MCRRTLPGLRHAIVLVALAACIDSAVARLDGTARLRRDKLSLCVPQNYQFFAGQDVPGNDLYLPCNERGIKSPNLIAAECNGDANCLSFIIFTLNGVQYYCLKTVAGTVTLQASTIMSKSCEGFYRKKNVQGCQTLPAGFTYTAGKDVYGNDIWCGPRAGKRLSTIAGECTGNGNCAGFNVFQLDGLQHYCLKTVGGSSATLKDVGVLMADPCEGFYQRAPVAGGCAAVPPGYSYWAALDVLGNDIVLPCPMRNGKPLATIAAECTSNPACMTFNIWTGGDGQQYYCFKSGTGRPDSTRRPHMTGMCEGSFRGRIIIDDNN